MILLASAWLNPFDWTTDDWAAVTFLVLLGAAIFAYFQVREARKLREAQVRPFVNVDWDLHQTIVDMVITNTGPTLAKNVRLQFDPPLRSSRDSEPGKTPLADAPIFKDGIPSIPPGKRIVFIFDRSPEMIRLELPLTYRVTMTYTGEPLGRKYEEETVLDLNIHREVSRVIKLDIHDVAKQLKTIAEEMRKWTIFGNALHVMDPQDVDARNRKLDAWFEERKQEHDDGEEEGNALPSTDDET